MIINRYTSSRSITYSLEVITREKSIENNLIYTINQHESVVSTNLDNSCKMPSWVSLISSQVFIYYFYVRALFPSYEMKFERLYEALVNIEVDRFSHVIMNRYTSLKYIICSLKCNHYGQSTGKYSIHATNRHEICSEH